ncbi:MAG: sugar phosphate isomerase/epimerase family protein [Ferruginibacter sp.]
MDHFTRREFLQKSALLLVTAYAGSSFDLKKGSPLLSFSTLGCPDWTFRQIVDFAAQHEYNGIELRGIQRELDLLKCNEFSSNQNRLATVKIMNEKGLKFVDLGSSANLHSADPIERKKNLDEARRFIDLAQQINCPYIRVFPNDFPKNQEKNATLDLIIKGLLELGDHAKGTGVSILMESHGALVKIEDLENVMKSAEHPQVGLIWDIVNMWSVTKEPPLEAYTKLKKYIRHTHIKDAKFVDGKIEYTLLGKGEAPIFEAMDALIKGGYKGYYSFEWEKLWHPEIAEPEVALAEYAKVMKQHFK